MTDKDSLELVVRTETSQFSFWHMVGVSLTTSMLVIIVFAAGYTWGRFDGNDACAAYIHQLIELRKQ